jgi:broad specificity phosphatase PhoE
MEIYLLRHGTSTANERQLVCGASDYPLSEKGNRQAIEICAHLDRIVFNRIYTSPLTRAKNTISSLNANVVPVLVEEIKELDTGDVSHITLDELWASDIRYKRPWLTPELRYPGGENFNEMIARITRWYEEQLKIWTFDEKILIVGHEGTLRSIYMKIMRFSINNYPEFAIDNCDYLHFKNVSGSSFEVDHVKFMDVK